MVQCSNEGCEKRPHFGPVDGKPTHCATHKKEDYVNVVSKRCAEEGCQKKPAFGPVDGKATHCATHKKEDYVNVVSKRCCLLYTSPSPRDS